MEQIDPLEPMEGFDIDGDELVAERGRPGTAWLDRAGLFLYGNATDNIWAMAHGDGIGLRFDSGESGFVYLTKEQAQATIATLQQMLGT